MIYFCKGCGDNRSSINHELFVHTFWCSATNKTDAHLVAAGSPESKAWLASICYHYICGISYALSGRAFNYRFIVKTYYDSKAARDSKFRFSIEHTAFMHRNLDLRALLNMHDSLYCTCIKDDL